MTMTRKQNNSKHSWPANNKKRRSHVQQAYTCDAAWALEWRLEASEEEAEEEDTDASLAAEEADDDQPPISALPSPPPLSCPSGCLLAWPLPGPAAPPAKEAAVEAPPWK